MPSVEKKRARDRRSQQRLRDKKEARIAELEKLVAHCKENHLAYSTQDAYSREVNALRHQNKSLLQRQDMLRSMVMSWHEPDLDVSPEYKPARAAFSVPFNGTESNNASPIATPDKDAATSDTRVWSQSTEPESVQSNKPPAWSLIPPHDDDFSNLETAVGCIWFNYPDMIKDCPDTPHSPLDLLYGSKLNPLADMIYSMGKRRPLREPERLATGWIAYHLTRWICAPSPATYGNMPLFLRPVGEQLELPHPVALNLVPWPKVRCALIRQWPKYRDNYPNFFGLFACCIRVRWPWGEDTLERSSDNSLVIREEFYKTFTSESGWTITREFVDEYPDIFAGVHLDSILYKFI